MANLKRAIQIDPAVGGGFPSILRAPGRGEWQFASHKRPPREELADGQLVTLALNGDRRAFPVLMARYEGKVRGLIGRRVRSHEDAEDLTQDTLASAWAALQTYPASRPFEIWLVCIALNKCRDWGRRRAVRQRGAIYLPELEMGITHDAEDDLIEAESAGQFHRALRTLPAQLREPLVLTAMEEFSQRDAARELGITVKAVETRVRRAKQQMRLCLTANCH
jgi:RNA polymerase sigma factor (sigma-70 family)